MKKRRVLACAVLAASLSLGGYGTYAYFTADAKVTNVITSGNIDIALHETMVQEDGEKVPFKDQSGVMPGSQVSKIVEVENTGKQAAYIRVQVEKKITLEEGKTGEPDESLVTCDFNTKDWTEKDGYYYYNAPLEAGETTAPLFEHVMFDKTMDNMYQGSKAEIAVWAQATQTANNTHSASNAQGWPESKN